MVYIIKTGSNTKFRTEQGYFLNKVKFEENRYYIIAEINVLRGFIPVNCFIVNEMHFSNSINDCYKASIERLNSGVFSSLLH